MHGLYLSLFYFLHIWDKFKMGAIQNEILFNTYYNKYNIDTVLCYVKFETGWKKKFGIKYMGICI